MQNNFPPWVELRKENWRVEVDQRGANTPNDMEILADDLNALFKEHRDWYDNNTNANVNYDEFVYCKLCNQKYIPSYDEKRKEEVCQYCGGGKLELALKILKDSSLIKETNG